MDHVSVEERDEVVLARPEHEVEAVAEELEFDRETLNDYLTMRHRT